MEGQKNYGIISFIRCLTNFSRFGELGVCAKHSFFVRQGLIRPNCCSDSHRKVQQSQVEKLIFARFELNHKGYLKR